MLTKLQQLELQAWAIAEELYETSVETVIEVLGDFPLNDMFEANGLETSSFNTWW